MFVQFIHGELGNFSINKLSIHYQDYFILRFLFFVFEDCLACKAGLIITLFGIGRTRALYNASRSTRVNRLRASNSTQLISGRRIIFVNCQLSNCRASNLVHGIRYLRALSTAINLTMIFGIQALAMAIFECRRSNFYFEVFSASRSSCLVLAIFVRYSATCANDYASRFTCHTFVRASNAAIAINGRSFVISIDRACFGRAIIFTSDGNIRAVLAQAEVLFRRHLLSSAILHARRCVIAVSRFHIIRILRARMDHCRVIYLGIRRILSNASLQDLITFQGFVCLRPMTLALLHRRRGHIIRDDQVSVFSGIFIANFASLQTCTTAILHARLEGQYALSMSRIQSNSSRFIVNVRVFQVRLFQDVCSFQAAIITMFFFRFGRLILSGLLTGFLITRGFFRMDSLLRRIFMFNVRLILRRSNRLTRTRFCSDADLSFTRIRTNRRIHSDFIQDLNNASGASCLIGIIQDSGRSFRSIHAFLNLTRIMAYATSCRFIAIFRRVFSRFLRIRRT